MQDEARNLQPAAQLDALESWRGNVLRGMLTVAAAAAPVIVVIATALRSAPYSWPRVVALVAAGLGLPVLRFVPGLSVRVRASIAVATSFGVGVVALMTFGFSSGPGIVLAGSCVFAVVFLGRRWGYVMIGLAVAAFFTVGSLAVRGVIGIQGVELDPSQMRNWTRIGVTFAFLTALLTTAIDFVIRHVEASSRAAARALIDLRLAYERLALLHERLDAAKEEERRFIAHELHDELGQVLTLIKLRLQTATADPNANAETLGLIEGLIARVRKMSGDLRPPLLDEVGLFPALRAYVDAQSALSGIDIRFEGQEPDSRRLDPDLEIVCFRVVQESLTNALRHASPRQIRVRAVRTPDSVALSIVDDGCGFDISALAVARGHLGIAGMQERVRARGGRFKIDARPGSGTSVEAAVPVDERADP
jgi:signal transduction histidine kinase